MNQLERLVIIAIGGAVSFAVTGTVCYAAIMSLSLSDGGLQNLLFGGLIGTGAFGAGALLAVLGMSRLQSQGTGTGGTSVNAEPSSAVTVTPPVSTLPEK